MKNIIITVLVAILCISATTGYNPTTVTPAKPDNTIAVVCYSDEVPSITRKWCNLNYQVQHLSFGGYGGRCVIVFVKY